MYRLPVEPRSSYARYVAAELALCEAVEEYEGKPLVPLTTNSPELELLRASIGAVQKEDAQR